MKNLVIGLLFIFNVNLFAEGGNLFLEKREAPKKGKTKVRKRVIKKEFQSNGVLWNTVLTDLNYSVHCAWKKADGSVAKLVACYSSSFSNRALALLKMNSLIDSYEVISEGEITYNYKTCELLMGDIVIGKYYGGSKCFEGSKDYGVRVIEADLYVDEEDQRLHFSHIIAEQEEHGLIAVQD